MLGGRRQSVADHADASAFNQTAGLVSDIIRPGGKPFALGASLSFLLTIARMWGAAQRNAAWISARLRQFQFFFPEGVVDIISRLQSRSLLPGQRGEPSFFGQLTFRSTVSRSPGDPLRTNCWLQPVAKSTPAR